MQPITIFSGTVFSLEKVGGHDTLYSFHEDLKQHAHFCGARSLVVDVCNFSAIDLPSGIFFFFFVLYNFIILILFFSAGVLSTLGYIEKHGFDSVVMSTVLRKKKFHVYQLRSNRKIAKISTNFN